MEFVTGLIIGITFWEIALFVLFFGVAIGASEFETGTAFVFGLVLLLLGLEFIAGWEVLATIMAQPFTVMLYAAVYTAIGGIYALLVSWPAWLRKQSSDIIQAKANYTKSAKLTGDDQFELAKFLNSYDYRQFTAAWNIDLIGSFITTWIFSAIWKCISRPIKWCWTTVYNTLSKAFARVGERITKDIIK
jgi:hypothetical protein